MIRISDTQGRLLGVTDTAVFLGVTPRSVLRLIERGMLIPVRLPGCRRTLFDRHDLEQLVQSAKERQDLRIPAAENLRHEQIPE